MRQGIGQGYMDFVNQGAARDHQAAQTQHLMAIMQALQQDQEQKQALQQRTLQDSQAGGGVLQELMKRMAAGGAPPQMGPPPMQGPNPMAPGGASVMAPPQAQMQMPMPMSGAPQLPQPPGTMGGGPQAPMPGTDSQTQMAPPPQAAPPIPPFRALPTEAPAYNAQGGLSPLDPPPSAPAQAGPPESPGINLKSLVEGFKAANIPPDRWMAQLEAFTPMMNASNKAELAQAQMQFKLQESVLKHAQEKVRELQADKRIDIAKGEAASKDRGREARAAAADESNAIKRAKIGTASGGTGNIAKWEYDSADPPNVVGGWTKTGKHIKLDQVGIGTPRAAADTVDKGRVRDVGALQRELNGLELSVSPTPADKARKEVLKKEIAALNAPKPKGGAAAAPGVLKTINSKAEFDALPPGASFIDGRTGKPATKGQ